MTNIYESNYLQANSPDGRYGLWLKHNLLRPVTGPGIGNSGSSCRGPTATCRRQA